MSDVRDLLRLPVDAGEWEASRELWNERGPKR